MSQMTLRTIVTRHLCYIFIRWLFWPGLNVCLEWDPYLCLWLFHHPLGSNLAAFGSASVVGMTMEAFTAKSQFWPLNWSWPDMRRFKQNFKNVAEYPRWDSSVAALGVSLPSLGRKLDGGEVSLPSQWKVDGNPGAAPAKEKESRMSLPWPGERAGSRPLVKCIYLSSGFRSPSTWLWPVMKIALQDSS